MDKSSAPYQAARALYRFVKWDVVMGGVLLFYGRTRHRKLLQRADRSDDHTYTSFYRSPPQLDALTGPVLDHIEQQGEHKEISILLFAASNGSEPYTLASELLRRRPGLRFRIRASDLHEKMVTKGASGLYTHDEVMHPTVPQDFVTRTFDRVDELYRVKPQIRERVSFEQADLLDPKLPERFEPADIVVMQNVLFHMPSDLARKVFANVIRTLKPGGALLIEGMELGMRVELTRRAGLVPLDYRVKEIHQHARLHFPLRWWNYYYASEPYSLLASDRLARYSTIFFAPK